MTSKESIREEHTSEGTGNGFKQPIEDAYGKGAYVLFVVPLEMFEVNGENPTIRGGFQEPIILDGSSSDPRLREDIPEPSPLTPQDVAKSLSPWIDTETGMPKIGRQPDLQPWEGVLYQ